MWFIDILPQGDDHWVVIKGEEPTSKELAEDIRRGTERALRRNGHPVGVRDEKVQTHENQVPELPGSTGEGGSKPKRRSQKGQSLPTK